MIMLIVTTMTVMMILVMVIVMRRGAWMYPCTYVRTDGRTPAQVLRKITSLAEKKKALADLAGYDLTDLDVYELKQL